MVEVDCRGWHAHLRQETQKGGPSCNLLLHMIWVGDIQVSVEPIGTLSL